MLDSTAIMFVTPGSVIKAITYHAVTVYGPGVGFPTEEEAAAEAYRLWLRRADSRESLRQYRDPLEIAQANKFLTETRWDIRFPEGGGLETPVARREYDGTTFVAVTA